MKNLYKQFDQIDSAIAEWMYAYGRTFLRISMAIVFIWFGFLKVVNISPANELIERTVYWISPDVFIPFLGWWEVIIGVGMLFKKLNRMAIFLLFLQMPGTMLPLVILPEICYTQIPFGLTMEGQYIIKNLVLISAALVIGGAVRGKNRK